MKECLHQDDNLSYAKVKTKLVSHEANNSVPITKHRRGYKHLTEIGNFSQFNEILKNNKNTLIKR